MQHLRFQWLAACLVVGLTLWLYLPSRSFDFIKFDDGDYVFDNPAVKKGLTLEGVQWAFTDVEHANWHPLTWLSLMADVEMFGINPGPMHLEDACLHALAAGLLFLWLVQLVGGWRVAGGGGKVVGGGGKVGRLDGPTVQLHNRPRASSSDLFLLASAAFAALLWALHPLRVESVAWISSRKDVLSVLFCLGGLMAYLADVRQWRSRWDGGTVGQADGPATSRNSHSQTQSAKSARSVANLQTVPVPLQSFDSAQDLRPSAFSLQPSPPSSPATALVAAPGAGGWRWDSSAWATWPSPRSWSFRRSWR